MNDREADDSNNDRRSERLNASRNIDDDKEAGEKQKLPFQ